MPRKPAIFSEPWSKITVVLFDRQVEFLDRVREQIRVKHGKAIPRSDVITAIVEAYSRVPPRRVQTLIVSRIGYNPRRNSTEP